MRKTTLKDLYQHDIDVSELKNAYSKLTGKTLHTEDEIIAASVVAPKLCGVYFLIHQNKIVYVGQSVNVWSRIGAHAAEGKTFSSASFVVCDKKHLDVVEALYIHTLRPRLNGNVSPSGVKAAQIGFKPLLDKLMESVSENALA